MDVGREWGHWGGGDAGKPLCSRRRRTAELCASAGAAGGSHETRKLRGEAKIKRTRTSGLPVTLKRLRAWPRLAGSLTLRASDLIMDTAGAGALEAAETCSLTSSTMPV